MTNFDRLIFSFVFKLRELDSALLDGLAIFLAAYLPYLLIVGFIFLIFKEKNRLKRLFLLLEGVLAIILSRGILVEIIRFFYHRRRPFEVLNVPSLISNNFAGSFPSGHAAFFFALALIVFSINRRWGKWYLILATLNGISRVFVGVHWPLDVIAGALGGLLSAQLVIVSLTPARKKINVSA